MFIKLGTLKEQEQLLLHNIASGDEKAFKSLIDRYKGYVFSISLKVLDSESYAEDLVQDVFLKIWLNRHKLTQINNFKAYLSAIASNQIYSILRKKLNEDNYLSEQAKTTVDLALDSETSALYVTTNSLWEDLEKAMSHLTPQQKRIFRLSRIEGFKHNEIADMLNISKETVKKHVMSSLQIVRKQMSGYDYFKDFIIIILILSVK